MKGQKSNVVASPKELLQSFFEHRGDKEKVKELSVHFRETLSLTQREFASTLGVDTRTVRRWELEGLSPRESVFRRCEGLLPCKTKVEDVIRRIHFAEALELFKTRDLEFVFVITSTQIDEAFYGPAYEGIISALKVGVRFVYLTPEKPVSLDSFAEFREILSGDLQNNIVRLSLDWEKGLYFLSTRTYIFKQKRADDHSIGPIEIYMQLPIPYAESQGVHLLFPFPQEVKGGIIRTLRGIGINRLVKECWPDVTGEVL